MNEQDLRLECLKLAWSTAGNVENTLTLAKKLYDWLHLEAGHPDLDPESESAPEMPDSSVPVSSVKARKAPTKK